jgi:exonuclease III
MMFLRDRPIGWQSRRIPFALLLVLLLLFLGVPLSQNSPPLSLSENMFFEGEEITISAINCNSLNMSNSAKWNQTLKICGITKLKSDIIFLSDIRISNKNLVSSSKDLEHYFVNNPYEKYDFLFNSSRNKRGTGILLKKNCSYQILHQRAADDENSILLHVNLKGTEIVLISIYGPNNTDNAFFVQLDNWLTEFGNLPVIIGGDWNATYSTERVESNINCLNMSRLPNLSHSNKIKDLCEKFELMDPYRTLYPDKKDFTFVPRQVDSRNKSRIDFFLISECLLDIVKDCTISPNLQNKLFDHKAITLTLNRINNKKIGRPTISKKDLDDDLLPFLVHATVAETYLLNCRDNEVNTQILLNTCGTIKALIRDCGPPLELRSDSNYTEEDQRARERKVTRLQVLINMLDTPALENLNLLCSPDILMETLLLSLKNEVISHQSFIRKKKLEKITNLKKKLDQLKKNTAENMDEISRLERDLNNLMDLEMRGELSKFGTYEILNAEKMTPRFLTLSKATKKIVSLDSIVKENGDRFNTREERYRHIRDFYSGIYTPDRGNNILPVNCIEEFLGPEVCQHEAVKNAKLNAAEKDLFDRQLTVQELDAALQKLNDKSAGGMDGIPTVFIKKFWYFLRIPLHKYALWAFENETLTQSFNSAGIKLIPKKGDVSKIKNWRPISLLNNIFKIISKALDTRLQKICEIVLSRGQKGFTKKRQMHECIINVVETIEYAKFHKIPSFVLALDMAKAFDTVRHDYMLHVYKFFGFGDNIIKMLNTISTGRTAVILTDEGEPTLPFALGTGFPQGNSPSPNQFNIGEQILIFKCEFDTRLKKIRDPLIERPFGEGGGGRHGCRYRYRDRYRPRWP